VTICATQSAAHIETCASKAPRRTLGDYRACSRRAEHAAVGDEVEHFGQDTESADSGILLHRCLTMAVSGSWPGGRASDGEDRYSPRRH